MKVFLDANILFSAADPASNTRHLLDDLAAKAQMVTSPHAIEEARRNLALKRPHQVAGLDELLRVVVTTGAFRRDIESGLPEQDFPIIAGAAGAECTHLWTGDQRHFGQWYGKQLIGVRVVSSRMLAEELTRVK
jgi:uncharacterized protein